MMFLTGIFITLNFAERVIINYLLCCFYVQTDPVKTRVIPHYVNNLLIYNNKYIFSSLRRFEAHLL